MPELLLPRLKREIAARLAELRPLVEEAAQLEVARRALLEDLVEAPARRSAPVPLAPLESPQRTEPPAPARGAVRHAEPSQRTEPSEPPARREPVQRVAPVMPRGSLLRSSPLLPGELRIDGGGPRKRPANGRGSGTEDVIAGASGPTERDIVLTLVEERPGVSVAEIVAVTKIAKSDVAALVSSLKREGVLADEAGGVKLASREPITLAKVAAAMPRANGTSDAEWDAARPANKRGA
jgi:hypothetical protein